MDERSPTTDERARGRVRRSRESAEERSLGPVRAVHVDATAVLRPQRHVFRVEPCVHELETPPFHVDACRSRAHGSVADVVVVRARHVRFASLREKILPGP